MPQADLRLSKKIQLYKELLTNILHLKNKPQPKINSKNLEK